MGNELQGLRFKQMRPFRRDMQIVFQDPYGSLSPRMSVADIIKEGLQVHHPNMPERERDERVVRALERCRARSGTRFRFPHEFSGGQRQRIAVARAIVLEPTFVVLDEPTSALDMLIQAQMVDLLRDLQKRRNLTYLFISHDLRVVAALASRLLVMRQGKVVEAGDAAELFQQPEDRLHARAVRRRVQSRDGAVRRRGAMKIRGQQRSVSPMTKAFALVLAGELAAAALLDRRRAGRGAAARSFTDPNIRCSATKASACPITRVKLLAADRSACPAW